MEEGLQCNPKTQKVITLRSPPLWVAIERKGNQSIRVSACSDCIAISAVEVKGGLQKFKKEVSMAKKSVTQRRLTKLDVYLYIPNIIGYIRVLMNCFAFAQCFSNKQLFSILYFVSFVCDGVDGWCARKFNQELDNIVSTFGAVLDMVTDRISTACLLVVLSQVYRPGLVFLSLLALDIASHWLQMYSTFLLGKASHKDVKDSTNWLFKAYYGNRMFMAYCCVACEVLYIILFLLAKNETESLIDVLTGLAKHITPLSVLVGLSLFGWAVKQAVNLIQLKTAADVCVLHDINKKQSP
ncbi:phosphatidylinositol synthase 1 [Prunus dulcis]|uniref:CDP-diacylglycerol--inositol 3-phosphatidyltransferase n=1 Tax=Prunus dulcis TaxID=3755 RepID=A0A4Y1RXY6_PRUDU|nr:phosphatidylinositol synthase 1 [Prunus dulcis]